jgi:hypothetical protein
VRASRFEPGTWRPPDASTIPWQEPNNTEGTAWEQVRAWSGDRGGSGGRAAYLPFPWASWIDAVQRGLPAPPPPRGGQATPGPVATVCQHIGALEHLHAMRAAGVSDLFWSHATRGGFRHGGLRIHPFPLLPVRCLSHPPAEPPPPPAERAWLYAFQGFQPPQGPGRALRSWLLDLPARPDALLERREEWHFEQQVYRELVQGQAPDIGRHRQLAEEARAYVAGLATCCFALCPAGAGPNSIRLWEALGFGAIPVILSERLWLPGSRELWQKAALFVPEQAEAVAALPDQLAWLRQDTPRLAMMQAAGRKLWQRYGPHRFAADVTDFLADPDGVLRTRALERLGPCAGGDGSAADRMAGRPVAELVSERPEELPRQLRRWLQEAESGGLLIRIADSRPPALQERLWGPAVRVCADLLANRPEIAWQVSCRAGTVEDLAPLPPD